MPGMASKIIILPTAERELGRAIAYQTALSPEVARRFVREFCNRLQTISDGVVEFPLSCIPELADRGYHAALVKRCAILYRRKDGRLEIAHIFHQHQDYARLVISQDDSGE